MNEVCADVPVVVEKKIKRQKCDVVRKCPPQRPREPKQSALLRPLCVLVPDTECHVQSSCPPIPLQSTSGKCRGVQVERCRVRVPGCKMRICDKTRECRLKEEKFCPEDCYEEVAVRHCRPCPKPKTSKCPRCRPKCFQIYSCPICLTDLTKKTTAEDLDFDEPQSPYKSMAMKMMALKSIVNKIDVKALKSYRQHDNEVSHEKEEAKLPEYVSKGGWKKL